MLRVTPIYGSYGHNPDNKSLSLPAMCTLIEYGGKRVLVDVGWDESQSLGGKGENTDMLPDADIVLVCNSSLSSIGGLPYHFGPKSRKKRLRKLIRMKHDKAAAKAVSTLSKAPPAIYGTLPTCKMGQMSLYDAHANISMDGGNPGWDLDDADTVFSVERFHTVNYSQPITLKTKKKKDALKITAHRAGNLVGGCFWVLHRVQDETEVVVAPTYHHAKEKHLDASTLPIYGATADVLITRPGGPSGLLSRLYSVQTQSPSNSLTTNNHTSNSRFANGKQKKPILQSPLVTRAEGELISLVMAALRRGGNVLLPVDASGRVMELLLLLNQYWEKNRLGTAYNLCWVGPMTWNTVEYAKSQLEWMASPLGQQFDSLRGHPYALKSVRICSSIAELEAIDEASNGVPMAVLASGANLDCGPARNLLLKFADNPDNAIILTDSQKSVPRPASMFSKLDVDSSTSIKPSSEEEDTNDVGTNGSTLGMTLSLANTNRSSSAAQLLLKWCQAKEAYQEMADVVEIDVLVPHRAPLVGNELNSFLAEEEAARLEKKALEERKALLREVELARGRLRLGEEDADDSLQTSSNIASTSANATTSQSNGNRTNANSTKPPPKKKSKFNQNLFLKFSKPIHMTFDVREEAVGIGQLDSIAKYGVEESVGRSGEVLEDDYGIAVIPEKFIDIVTGIDPSKIGGSGRLGDDVLRRGLGFGSDGRPVLGTGSGGGPAMMRSSSGEKNKEGMSGDMDKFDDLNEQALEASDLSEGKGIIRGRNGKEHIKVSTKTRILEVLAEVTYVPLEGRVDARAARQSVRALQPRQVIILGGGKLPHSSPMTPPSPTKNSDNTMEKNQLTGESLLLANAVKELTIQGNMGSSIFAPSDGKTLEINVGHAAFSARLIDTVYVEREKREAAALAGEILPPVPLFEPYEAKMTSCTVSLLDCVATGQKVAADGSIVLAPRAATEDSKQTNVMLSDGDVYLTDLRAEIIALGMKAEYSTHPGYQQLVVNGKIVIRKDQTTGKINVEGPLCESFFSVRSIVCSQFVTL